MSVSAFGRSQTSAREAAVRGVVASWLGLPSYDRENVPSFLLAMTSLMGGALLIASRMVAAYVSLIVGRGITPAPIAYDDLRGVPLDVVYQRPFITLWSELAKPGVGFESAKSIATSRLEAIADADMQLASRHSFESVQSQYNFFGYKRQAEPGACAFCEAINGAYIKSANSNPIHPRCGCIIVPLTSPHPRAVFLPDGKLVGKRYAVREHGEMGAMLTAPDPN